MDASNRSSGSRAVAQRLRAVENGILALLLVGAAGLPTLELGLRQLGHSLGDAPSLLQHLTLLIGLLGGAVAARDDKLLSLGATREAMPERWQARTKRFSYAVGAFVSVVLVVASWRLARAEMDSVATVAGIPVWVFQLVMPCGFALIAGRLVWTTGDRRSRWIALSLVVAMGAAVALAGLSELRIAESLALGGALTLILGSALLGSPVFATLAGIALAFFWVAGRPINSMAIHHYSLVTNPSLPAIPLFTIAGYFLSEGRAPQRILRVFEVVAGRFRGGIAVATVLSCAFFTSFSGASGITILALGGVVMPGLLAARMKERDALGLVTSSGAIGLLFAPCLPLILYAIVAQEALRFGGYTAPEGVSTEVTIERMFLAGVIPGLLLVALLALWGVWKSPRTASRGSGASVSRKEALAAFWDARWEIAIPFLALGAIFSGFATAVEAAALTAVYTMVVQTMIRREVRLWSEAPKILLNCGSLVGGVLLIFGVAVGLTKFLVLEEIPTKVVDTITATVTAKWAFLLALNVFLLLVGFLMDIFSAIVVVVPLILPLGLAFGLSPIHLGILFLANLELGYLTPPVGLNLFLASSRFEKPLVQVFRSVLSTLPVLALGVLLITFVPILSTGLPDAVLGVPEALDDGLDLELGDDDAEFELDLDF